MKYRLTIWRRAWVPVILIFTIAISIFWMADATLATTAESVQTVSDTNTGWIDYIKTHVTRARYDIFMRWVNFLILAGLLIKYTRKPLIKFIKDKKEEIAHTIGDLEEKKREAEDKVRESQNQLVASKERLELIKEKIIDEGQRRKAQIIGEAQAESRVMLEMAKLRIDNQIQEAFHHLKSELIDMATERAGAKLPAVLSADDHHQLISQWVEAVKQ